VYDNKDVGEEDLEEEEALAAVRAHAFAQAQKMKPQAKAPKEKTKPKALTDLTSRQPSPPTPAKKDTEKRKLVQLDGGQEQEDSPAPAAESNSGGKRVRKAPQTFKAGPASGKLRGDEVETPNAKGKKRKKASPDKAASDKASPPKEPKQKKEKAAKSPPKQKVSSKVPIQAAINTSQAPAEGVVEAPALVKAVTPPRAKKKKNDEYFAPKLSLGNHYEAPCRTSPMQPRNLDSP